jgi:hypothetical protein
MMRFCTFSKAVVCLTALANIMNPTSASRTQMSLPSERRLLNCRGKIQVS